MVRLTRGSDGKLPGKPDPLRDVPKAGTGAATSAESRPTRNPDPLLVWRLGSCLGRPHSHTELRGTGHAMALHSLRHANEDIDRRGGGHARRRLGFWSVDPHRVLHRARRLGHSGGLGRGDRGRLRCGHAGRVSVYGRVHRRPGVQPGRPELRQLRVLWRGRHGRRERRRIGWSRWRRARSRRRRRHGRQRLWRDGWSSRAPGTAL